MGFSFTLESANMFALLTERKVDLAFEQLTQDRQLRFEFVQSLYSFEKCYYSNSDNKQQLFERVKQLRGLLSDIPNLNDEDYQNDIKREKLDFEPFAIIHKNLSVISEALSKCRYKALLLPKVLKDRNNFIWELDFMTNQDLLRDLVKMHPGDSCLILQPQYNMSETAEISLINSFPHMDKALKQIHNWPGVLLWNDSDSVFIPVSSSNEVECIFRHLRDWEIYDEYHHNLCDKYLYRWIKGFEFARGERDNKSHYIIHLSDLHFNNKSSKASVKRLKQLLLKQIENIEDNATIRCIISGDMVNSPNTVNSTLLEMFMDDIELYTKQTPICVLGNHDVNNNGLAITNHNNKLIANIHQNNNVITLEKEKIILLMFNSNTKGFLAQGCIGIEQMIQIGNELDKIKNIQDYTIIAVLHHHITTILEPEWHKIKWYQSIFPQGFRDWSLKLTDADIFIEWLKQRNVKMVFHGHKHIPFMDSVENIHVLGCGSSTGKVTHKDKNKTYLSYNVIGFHNGYVTYQQYAEEVWGAGASCIRTESMRL